MKINSRIEKEYLEKIIKKPNDRLNYEELYKVYMESQNYKQAIDIINRLLLKEKYSEGYYLLGEAYCKFAEQQEDDNEYENALQAYESAINLDCGNVNYYLCAGKLQAEVFRDVDEAIKNLEKAFSLEKNDTLSVLIAGQYYILNEVEKSTYYYKKALELNPKNIEANIYLGEYLYDVEKYQECLVHIDNLLKMGIDMNKVASLLKDCLVGVKRYEEAIKICDFMINNYQNKARAYVNRAKVYKLLGEVKKSIKDYTKAISYEPKSSYFYFERGLAYCEIKEKENAKKDLNQMKLLRASEKRINELARKIEEI